MTQTLAMLLARETSLAGTEQIDFDHPAVYRQDRPRLGLYCYDLRQSRGGFPGFHPRGYATAQNRGLPHRSFFAHSPLDLSTQVVEPQWFDISFIVSAWDWTEFGEKQLLSEALVLLLRHRLLPSDQMVPSLQGKGNLEIRVSTVPLEDVTALWRALAAPLRPAIYITVTLPFMPPQLVASPSQTSLSESFKGVSPLSTS